MATLNVNNINCRYGAIKVLEGIDFAVKPGDFVGILGPNGSGKTTLLKSISRVLKPYGGAIFIDEAAKFLKNLDSNAFFLIR